MYGQVGLSSLNSFLSKYQAYIALVLTLVVVGLITTQNILLSGFGYETVMGSFYNNYLIFKNSFFHLLDNENLYVLYKSQQIDLFKYSPTFSLFFAVFANLPDWLGLFLWNGLNALVFYALWQIKFPSVKNKFWIWAFVLIEFITNIQSSQSNGLMAGLMILGYVFLERKNLLLATLMIVLSAYIKVFGVVAFALFHLCPEKWKAVGYSIMWAIVLFVLPLLVISPSELLIQYQNWLVMMRVDAPVPFSLSVVGWLKYWFHYEPNGMYVLGVGTIMFLAPFIRFVQYKNPVYKQLVLASVLMWVVLFNHKAESPTFIIAVAGVAIWYFSQPTSLVKKIMLGLVLLFTQLAPTDLFPFFVRDEIFKPYVIKVVPVIIVWLKVQFDIFELDSQFEERAD